MLRVQALNHLLPDSLYSNRARSEAACPAPSRPCDGWKQRPVTAPWGCDDFSGSPLAQSPTLGRTIAPSPLALPAAALASSLPAAQAIVAASAREQQSLGETLKVAGKKALGGGIPGAAAMAVQVLLPDGG